MKKVLFILILGMSITACDQVEWYYFILKNDTKSKIKITYTNPQTDTLFFIQPNEVVKLQYSIKITKPGIDYYKNEPIPLYKNLSITKDNDSVQINVRDRKNWEFRLKDSLRYMYVLNLEEKHFSNKK